MLREAIRSGLAQSTDEALDQAHNTLRSRLPKRTNEAESTSTITRRPVLEIAIREKSALATVDF